MLVLTRKQNEEIVIGDNVKVTVLQIKGNSIRLGIEAPRDVRIVRGELPPKEAPQTAEVTVVFSSDREQAGNNLEIVPFKQPEEKSGGGSATASKAVEPAVEHRAISFRQGLPESLQHNRLQQIVNELTQK